MTRCWRVSSASSEGTISLAEYQRGGQIPPDANWGTLELAYTGRRADLVAVAVSYDKTNRYGLQTPFSEDLSRLWVGGMWHIDGTHNTFIVRWNKYASLPVIAVRGA